MIEEPLGIVTVSLRLPVRVPVAQVAPPVVVQLHDCDEGAGPEMKASATVAPVTTTLEVMLVTVMV